MQYRDPRKLPRDLVQLVEKQLETLEREMFGGATDVELREYEERQGRIDELCRELKHVSPAG